MSRHLKLLACMLYVTFATAACYPIAQTSNKDAVRPHADKNVTVVAESDIPETAYKLVEYEVLYDTNRVVHCIGLKAKSITQHVTQTSLNCDWERSRWDGIH